MLFDEIIMKADLRSSLENFLTKLELQDPVLAFRVDERLVRVFEGSRPPLVVERSDIKFNIF